MQSTQVLKEYFLFYHFLFCLVSNWPGWRNRQARAVWCLTNTGARSCSWDSAPEEPGTGRDLCGCELPCWKRPGDPGGPQLTSSQQQSRDANCTLGCIYGSFISRDRDVIIPHYSALVRSHMEHCLCNLKKKKKMWANWKGSKWGPESCSKGWRSSPLMKDWRR